MEQRLPRRRKMRLPEYDYSSAGYYFITICTKDKRCLFGKIVQSTAPQFQPKPTGKSVGGAGAGAPRGYFCVWVCWPVGGGGAGSGVT